MVTRKLKVKSEIDETGRRVRYTWVAPLNHVLSRPIETLMTPPPIRRQASDDQTETEETETAVDLGLSPELIMSRFREFLKSPGEHRSFTPLAEIQGLISRCEELKAGLSADDADSLNRLLVLFFGLGMHASEVNLKALENHALDDIRKMPKGRYKSKEVRESKKAARAEAYAKLVAAAASLGYKPTFGGVVSYLRAQDGQSFSTGVEWCPRIWYLPGGDSKSDLYDSQRAPNGGRAPGDKPTLRNNFDELTREAREAARQRQEI